MKQNNVSSLREILDQMSTQQLDEVLHGELGRENTDENSVRMILDVLREREKEQTVTVSPELKAVWNQFRMNADREERKTAPVKNVRTWILRTASAAAILLVLISVVPRQAGAESFWERLIRWTDEIMVFLSPGDNEMRM